jgi:hypothetical protein
MHCKSCNAENPASYEFCGHCRADLRSPAADTPPPAAPPKRQIDLTAGAPIRCPRCAATNFDSQRYCGACAYDLRLKTFPEPQPPIPMVTRVARGLAILVFGGILFLAIAGGLESITGGAGLRPNVAAIGGLIVIFLMASGLTRRRIH